MAQDPTEYLAVNVLNEQQLISYRMLSRALKVHSNVAKQMLEEFHRKQNAKKQNTVHATYLITGTRRYEPNGHADGTPPEEDEDTIMQSSPPLPSSSVPKSEEMVAEQVAVRSVLLVKEEYLEHATATFEDIVGIHVYSLQASGLSDMQPLVECNRKIALSYASEDPLQAWKQYGTIQNPNVKRRALGRKTSAPAPAAKDINAKTKLEGEKPKPAALEKQESKPASKPSSAKATQDSHNQQPAVTKRQNSDIFKSFAKHRTNAKKQEPQSLPETPPTAQPDDEPMNDFSDEDIDGDSSHETLEEPPKVPQGKSKKEREAELKAMMEQEDEAMEDAHEAISENADTHNEDEGAIDKPEEHQAEEPNETVRVENGRRRGRRTVMKKKTVKDEDGYLVTKEEPAWESFSEEEPASKKAKSALTPSNTKPAAKKGGKAGQGNIMSFFSKK